MPAQQQQRLTKRQRRVLRQQGILDQNNNFSHGFSISNDISPMTDNPELGAQALILQANHLRRFFLLDHGLSIPEILFQFEDD